MAIETVLLQPVSGDSAITYSARQLRAHLVANIFSREGVIDFLGGDLKVTQRSEGANFTVDIAVGGAAVFGDDQAGQGAYSVRLTTKENRTVPAASTTTTRTHRVILQVRDRLENASFSAGTYNSQVVVQADTNAAAALPPSSIPLATIAVPANAVSVTTSMITDLRKPASVGTPDLTGSVPPRPDGYTCTDSARPFRYAVNPDGWVSLGGWCVRTGATTNVTANTLYDLTTAPLADPIRPVGYRDFIGVCSEGPVQYTVRLSGNLAFSVRGPAGATYTLTQNISWFSLDGCGFRL